MCLETAGSDIENGAASSPMVAAPTDRRAKMWRRVRSESAEKIVSSVASSAELLRTIVLEARVDMSEANNIPFG